MDNARQDGAAGEAARPSRQGRRWRRVLWAVLAVPLAAAVALVMWFAWMVISFMVSDDPFNTHSQAGCSRAMEFAHGSLPEGTTDEDCSVDEWMDTVVRGTFRMPRADVADWLKATTYPDEKPKEHCTQDVCLDISYPSAQNVVADEVRLTVEYENADSALVTLEAFDA
ncbi:hypothetical protein [Streptomyces sp. NPDC002889]|uniref:hypothetical protein n=1 Tax=Streptomyces sp. NPDC002889 TaxID=3364669 RepID=UPI003693A601